MATGRTVKKWCRVYDNGYNLSGYTMDIGPLTWEYDAETAAALSDPIKGALPNHPSVKVGTLNGVLDNTALTGLHVLNSVPGGLHLVATVLGVRAEPIEGDPVFAGAWHQNSYQAGADGPFVPVTLEFGEWGVDAAFLNYGIPWGALLRAASAAITAPNDGTGVDDFGAATTKGGWGMLQVLAGNGTATFSIEAAAVNSDAAFDAAGALLTFDTTAAATPFAEMKALSLTASVARYLRWQVALGSATTVTAIMAFMRRIQ